MAILILSVSVMTSLYFARMVVRANREEGSWEGIVRV